MGQKYTTQTQSGYNASPPPDDGSTGSNNLVTWAAHKTKLGDPLLTLAQNINSALVNALDFGGRTTGINDTATASDHMKTIECSAATTETLPTAASVGAGYIVNIKNTATATNVSIALQTATDTLEGTVNGTDTLYPGQSAWYKVNNAGDGYYILSDSQGAPTYSGPITSTVATGTAPFTVASTTPVTNLSIGGNAATATTILPSGTKGIGILKFGALNITQNATTYAKGVGCAVNATESQGTVIAPRDMTISQLRVSLNAAVPAANSLVATVRINQSDTAITCTISAAGTTGSDLVNSVQVMAGSLISIKLVASATFTSTIDGNITLVAKDYTNTFGVTPMALIGVNNGSAQIIGEGNTSGSAVPNTAGYGELAVPPCIIKYETGGIASSTGVATGSNPLVPRKNATAFLTSVTTSGSNSYSGANGYNRTKFTEGDTFSPVSTAATVENDIMSFLVDPSTQGAYPPTFTYLTSHQQAQATTFYMGGYGTQGNTTTESEVQIPMPACTVKNLRITSSTAVAATTTVITIRKNGVDTAVTATLTTSGTYAADLTNTVAFAAGDLLSIKVVTGATTGTRNYNATFEMVA